MQRIKKRDIDFKIKMLGIILIVLIPMFAVITVLFYRTNITMKKKFFEMLEHSSEKIMSSIDDTLWNIYNVSDAFSRDENLSEYVDKTYEEDFSRIKKAADMVTIVNQLFAGYDLLRKNEKIGAIYTYKNELFNFQDMNHDGEDCIEKLKELNIEDPDKLSKFYWYPLQDNFFKSTPYGEIRKDRVVIGSRRIYSTMKAAYTCVHLFVLKEESLYEKYAENAAQLGGDVFILNGEAQLLSTSHEAVLEKGDIPQDLKDCITNRTQNEFEWRRDNENYMVRVKQSEVNDWLTVVAVPEKVITKPVDDLYSKIFAIIILCITICCLMLVYNGNLDAYVEISSQNEIGKMMGYYNSMLESINHNIKERLEIEKKKKEMEMEVLMSQINPHFLYNTLETIVWKSGEAKRPDIGRIAASLGRLYRLSISGGDIIVRLQQEVEHLMAYIKIQKSRYGDQFEFDLQTDPEVIREWYTLKLILQPLVENSFIYAMEGLDRPLIIKMDMKVRRDVLQIRIADNGIGMDEERLRLVRKQIKFGKAREEDRKRKSSGIGLHSVEERLRLYFGVERGVRIYSVLGQGTLTVLNIPKLKKEDIKEDKEQ